MPAKPKWNKQHIRIHYCSQCGRKFLCTEKNKKSCENEDDFLLCKKHYKEDMRRVRIILGG